MQDSYIIRYDLTWMEYYNLSLALLFRQMVIRGIVIVVAVCALLSTLIRFADPLTHRTTVAPAFQALIVSAIGIVLFFVAGMGLFTGMISSLRPDIIRGHSYRFLPAGMERLTASEQFMIPWKAFRRIRESRSFFWLYVEQNNTRQTHVVQKRMLADEDSVRAFKRYIEEQMGY
jgi:hypothetical protein